MSEISKLFRISINSLRDAGSRLELGSSRTRSSGSDAKAVAYIEIKSGDSYSWGVGMHRNTVIAGLGSIISALNKISSS